MSDRRRLAALPSTGKMRIVRILHTSDWHLGLMSGRFSRAEEHRLFLQWLRSTLREQRIDALIIAGDIFDGMSPSNESQRLYYRFVSELKDTGVRDVVIVGGNHDSASQLEAPRAVLSTLDVHVVGGYSRESDKLSYLVPLRERGSDVPVAICIALPYVHEWHLGIRTTEDSASTRKDFIDRFSALYSDLADLAAERYPELPLIGTGHLSVGKVEPGDSPQEIHQVGLINSLPSEVLDARMKYVALGHIHRSFSVDKGRAWYSGSPIPISLPEAKRPRRVLLVELPLGRTPSEVFAETEGPSLAKAESGIIVTPLPVPLAREMVEMRGSEEEVLTRLGALSFEAPLPPLLYLRVIVTEPEPQLLDRIRETLERFSPQERPLLVEVREHLAQPLSDPEEEEVLLEDLSPREVFVKLCRQQKFEPGEELLQSFDHVASIDRDTLESQLEAITKGKAAASLRGKDQEDGG